MHLCLGLSTNAVDAASAAGQVTGWYGTTVSSPGAALLVYNIIRRCASVCVQPAHSGSVVTVGKSAELVGPSGPGRASRIFLLGLR